MSHAIKKLQAKGIRWNTILSVVTFLAQFIALYFLNKIIAPEDFGKAVTAISAINIGMALSNLSYGAVAIREKEISEEQLNTIFLFSIITNIILFITFFFLIPQLNIEAVQFSKPYIKAFSFAYILGNFALVPFIKLQREMLFSRYSSLLLIAKVISLCGAIFFAVRQDFFWSLFFLYGGFLMVRSLLVCFSIPWKITNMFDTSFLKKSIGMGASFTMHQFVGTVGSNLGSLLIGNQYGEQPVGEYHKSMGYRSMPIMYVATPIAQVMFPTFSKLQHQPRELSDFFMLAQKLTGFLLMPVFFLLFAMARPFTELYFDEDWNIDRITVLLQIFSIVGVVNIFNPNFYSFFSVVSKPKEINQIVLFQQIITILAIIVTFKFGIITVAIGVLVAQIISLLINIFYGKKYFYRSQLKSVLLTLFKTTVISIFCAFIGYLFFHHLTVIVSPVVHFLLACITSAMTYLLLSFGLNKSSFTIFIDTFLKS